MFGYDGLENFYKTNFNLMHHYKYSLSDMDNLMPWERHIYIDLLQAHLKEEKQRKNEEESNMRATSKR